MSGPILDFVPIWTLILGVGVFLYVLLDGFDLGVGILYGFAPDRDSRNLVMNSIAPIWDGNETWLVLGGVALLAAFPLAFAIIMPAVYFPIIAMLLALVFRGVAFEFRFRDAVHRTFWDHAFSYGSAIGAFAQGVTLGAFIQGFETDGRHFAGHSLDCFTPFSLMTGVALVFGYALLGAGWLVLKTEGDLQAWARQPRALRLHRRRDRHCGGQPVDPVPSAGDRRALVLLAAHRLSLAGADRDRARRLLGMALAQRQLRGRALHLRGGSVRDVLCRTGDQPVSDDRALQIHDLGGGLVGSDAGLHGGRHAVPAARHPHVHGLVLLGVPRQGARRHRLSLKRIPSPRVGRRKTPVSRRAMRERAGVRGCAKRLRLAPPSSGAFRHLLPENDRERGEGTKERPRPLAASTDRPAPAYCRRRCIGSG